MSKEGGVRTQAEAHRRFKPYPAYKDSGVEWLGQIPAHWTSMALKRIGGLQAGTGFPDDEQGLLDEELPFFKVGDMGMPGNEREMLAHQHSVSRATARRLGAFVFPPRTIIFAKVGAALMLNRRRLLVRPSCIDNNMMGFMPSDCDPTWAMYWLSGLDMGELANPGAVPSVNEGQMRDTPAALPPPNEQRAIAAFLDRETARIDALVAKKERLIELLQEKRTALITRAVTKGLDPTVPMKDSGVEWLGEIPAHWEVKPLRWALSIRSGEALDNTEFEVTQKEGLEVPVIGGNGVMGYTNRANSETACIALGRVGALCGNVHLVDPPAWITDNALVASDIRGFERQYLALLLRVLDLNRWASQNAQPLITGSFVKAQRVCAPPDEEQRAIAAFLDQETAKIDALVAKVREAIERLKELRTALISAAVTGKIDVREEAA